MQCRNPGVRERRRVSSVKTRSEIANGECWHRFVSKPAFYSLYPTFVFQSPVFCHLWIVKQSLSDIPISTRRVTDLQMRTASCVSSLRQISAKFAPRNSGFIYWNELISLRTSAKAVSNTLPVQAYPHLGLK